MDDIAAATIKDGAEVKEGTSDIEVRDVDVPVVMGWGCWKPFPLEWSAPRKVIHLSYESQLAEEAQEDSMTKLAGSDTQRSR
ncbi:MAG: hypothetical protein U1D30_11955 [Planctomycetota bacterium]